EEHQLETGTSFGLFQQDYSNTAILASDTWLKRVWKELEDLDICVALDTPVLPLRCESDALLIEVFMELEVDQDALKWLNWCRMFLQVCTVSDIVTADGRSIRESIWHGERDYTHRSSSQWPHTVRPNRNHWRVWQENLTRALLVSDGTQRLLRHPLGPWFDPINDWNWLWSSTHGLFHRQGHGWQHYRHRRSPTRSLQWDYTRPAQLSGRKRPHNEPANNGACFLSAPFWTHPLPEDVSEVTEYVGWTPEEIEIDGDESLLAEALLEDRLCVISDGSYKLGLGTAAVQLLPRKGVTERIIVCCQTPGLPDDQSAYRSELIGLLAGILIAPNTRFFTKLAALYIGDVKQSRLNPEHIQELVALPALRKRWHERQTITPEAELETDWTSLARAMSSLPAGVQRRTTKHVVGMCGVGKFKVRWGSADSAACPCCGEFEDHLHVPRCMAPSASAEWDRRTVTLDQWLDAQVTDPAIKHAILHLLQGVRDPSLPSSWVVPARLCSAFLSQQCIDYQGLLEGRLSVQWAALQEQYLESQGSQRSPTLWVSRLLHQLILLGFHMWEHRNSVQHLEDNVQLRERSRLLNDGIHSQFDMGPIDLPKVVQRMLAVKRRTVLNTPLVDREEWLKLVRMERTAYRRALAPQRRILHRFFHPAQVP
ncbi:unnamed protein product, partial [Cylindrotheca closterium]